MTSTQLPPNPNNRQVDSWLDAKYKIENLKPVNLAALRVAAEACGPRLCSLTGDEVVQLLDMIEKPTLFEAKP